MTELSDELLVAYVDGQLARDQSKAVERVLEYDDVAAQRVLAMRGAQTRLEAAFEAMLDNELTALTESARGEEPAGSPAPARSESAFAALRRRGALAVFGGAMTLLLAGAAGGYSLHAIPGVQAPAPRAGVPVVTGALARREWQEDLVIAHSLFGRETLTIGLESQGNLDLLRFQLANAVGTDVPIPDLRDKGLAFARAQILRRDGEAMAQLAYLPATGDPVALYAHWDEGPETAASFRQIDGVSAAAWRRGDLFYLLAGRMPLSGMETLAEDVRERIAAGDSLQSDLEEPLSAAEARAMAPGPAPAALPEDPESASAGSSGTDPAMSAPAEQ